MQYTYSRKNAYLHKLTNKTKNMLNNLLANYTFFYRFKIFDHKNMKQKATQKELFVK